MSAANTTYFEPPYRPKNLVDNTHQNSTREDVLLGIHELYHLSHSHQVADKTQATQNHPKNNKKHKNKKIRGKCKHTKILALRTTLSF